MKRFLQYLSPFAPDQSGASAVLYELGGLIVICDAGGCAGNVCGFDEPRWFFRKSAIFSAGLRDMDAILGRDDRLIAKLADAAAELDVSFAALVGTPVPAVIGTDFRALRRMGERRTGLPVLAVETKGTGYYDAGEEAAYDQLFRTFAAERFPVIPGTLGVLGATPLELSRVAADSLQEALTERHWKDVRCYGMGAGLEQIRRSSQAEKNLVIAPAGLKAARYLQKTFGTPYGAAFPLLPEGLVHRAGELAGKRVLVIHQQVAANALRAALERAAPEVKIDVATWFLLEEPLKRAADFRLTDEGQFAGAVKKGRYDVVIGDETLRRALPDFSGEFWDFPHFAVSGRLVETA